MSNRPELPADLRRFVMTSVPSVPFLEALLLLRAEPGTPWTADMMARRLYLGEPQARALLEAIAARGFAQAAGAPQAGYRFSTASTDAVGLLDRLAQHYSVDVVTVADLIHSRLDKQAQQFADAFRFRKDK